MAFAAKSGTNLGGPGRGLPRQFAASVLVEVELGKVIDRFLNRRRQRAWLDVLRGPVAIREYCDGMKA